MQIGNVIAEQERSLASAADLEIAIPEQGLYHLEQALNAQLALETSVEIMSEVAADATFALSEVHLFSVCFPCRRFCFPSRVFARAFC
jgi:hypothetical protein